MRLSVHILGSTIDITTHEVVDSGKVKAVNATSGGVFGGNLVKLVYEDLLHFFVGQMFIKFKSEHTEKKERKCISEIVTVKKKQPLHTSKM